MLIAWIPSDCHRVTSWVEGSENAFRDVWDPNRLKQSSPEVKFGLVRRGCIRIHIERCFPDWVFRRFWLQLCGGVWRDSWVACLVGIPNPQGDPATQPPSVPDMSHFFFHFVSQSVPIHFRTIWRNAPSSYSFSFMANQRSTINSHWIFGSILQLQLIYLTPIIEPSEIGRIRNNLLCAIFVNVEVCYQ